ncbi:hypothetical protein GCK72_010165 [Caenorhabditis remanei]|nr:hypothetical protein GCK72_010165 [Caenorhabditis remanei]KAF1761906.1 hypothetical protein GCK72_010165 [Caenorhabditis remanei]
MFVVYLKSQHKKNQLHEEEKRIEEEKAYRERLAAVNNQSVSTTFGGGTTSSIRENEQQTSEKMKSEKTVPTEKTENSSKMNEYSVRSSDETIGDKSEIVQKESNICLKSAPISSTIGSKEPSTEELSSKKSLTDLKPIIIKSENKGCGGEVSVEIPIKTQDPPIKKQVLSAESAPGSSIGSDVSTYVISSQRSEMNNYNMLEAGRTPPTYSENALHQTSSIETFVPMTQIQSSSVGTPLTVIVAPGQRNSETAVSMTTPPINHK